MACMHAQVSSMQLMDNYCPYAAGLLCVLVPIFEPLGFNSMVKTSQQDTLLNYNYTPAIVGAIALTAVLGLLVSLSTFLVIGATSSLTYNVVSTKEPLHGFKFSLSCENVPCTKSSTVEHSSIRILLDMQLTCYTAHPFMPANTHFSSFGCPASSSLVCPLILEMYHAADGPSEDGGDFGWRICAL